MLSIPWWITGLSSYLPFQCRARLPPAFLFAGPLQRQSWLTGVSFLIYRGCLIEDFFSLIQEKFAILTFRFICFQNLSWVPVWILMMKCTHELCRLRANRVASLSFLSPYLCNESIDSGCCLPKFCRSEGVKRRKIREILGSLKSRFLPFQWERLFYSVCCCPSRKWGFLLTHLLLKPAGKQLWLWAVSFLGRGVTHNLELRKACLSLDPLRGLGTQHSKAALDTHGHFFLPPAEVEGTPHGILSSYLMSCLCSALRHPGESKVSPCRGHCLHP